MKNTGECFCGDVRYEYEGELLDARSCHCSRCRKVSSAQASAYALIKSAGFNWMCGEEQLTSYVGNEGFGIQFCSKCGSTLCGILEGVVHGVMLGCVNGDPEVEIARHIYVGSKAGWEVMPLGVVTFEENEV
jgi:hypothetical protein